MSKMCYLNPTPNTSNLRILLAVAILTWIFSVSSVSAAITSWWRFEVDMDPSISGLISPNEIGGEPPLVSNGAVLDFYDGDLYVPSLPATSGISNSSSLRSFQNGLESDGIYGTAAYSPKLDTSSVTVEFIARTTESTLGFVSRTSNNSNAGEAATITDGFSIVDSDSVRVNFFTSAGPGESPILTTLNSNISINDGDWHYVGFGYNSITNAAVLKVDEQMFSIALDSGTGTSLWWGEDFANPEVMVGYQMDGDANNFGGTIDEIRFNDVFTLGSGVTPIPEPSQVFLGIAGLLYVLLRRLKKKEKSDL